VGIQHFLLLLLAPSLALVGIASTPTLLSSSVLLHAVVTIVVVIFAASTPASTSVLSRFLLHLPSASFPLFLSVRLSLFLELRHLFLKFFFFRFPFKIGIRFCFYASKELLAFKV